MRGEYERGLSGRVAKDILAVCVEAKIPQADLGHELLRLLQLPFESKKRVDKLNASALAERRAPLLGSRAKHGSLAGLEKLAKLVGKAVTGVHELLEDLLVLLGTDLVDTLIGTLDFSGQLNQEQPQLSGHLGDRSSGTMMVDSPVIDPFAKGVGIKDTPKQQDRLLRGVPVLQRISGRDLPILSIFLGRHTCRRWRLLVGGAGWPGCLGALGDCM